MKFDDTIAAISSAAGSGARAIVRLSGQHAMPLACRVFAGTNLREIKPFRCADGWVRFSAGAGGEVALPCRAYVFRAPRSFTRQDVVELHIPGSPVAAGALLEHLVQLGARRAQAGEFTARAFFSGRLDLSEAQAVADIIDAATDAQLRQATSALGGRIARCCGQAADELAGALASVEASIDLADEAIDLDSPRDLALRATQVAQQLRRLAAESADMPEHAHLPHVVLFGLSNAGKSSLLNALSGTERAIVSPVAGTTRDVLGATILLAGSAVVVQDAAGLDGEAPHATQAEGAAAATITQTANQAARAAIAAADVLLLVLDASNDIAAVLPPLVTHAKKLNRLAPILVLLSKADLLEQDKIACMAVDLKAKFKLPAMGTSAVTGSGLEQLRTELTQRLHLRSARAGDALGLHRWQKQCFVSAAEAASRAAELLEGSAHVADQAELVAIDLRTALADLGQISGQIVNEDILGRIFDRFCVGK